ncbi:hypothetical protein GCM10007100_35970 [Roseibacillus persicicus]|uniref:Single-stranded DNA-binding protein n=2 Tax=Roseibacillus persicicus TaxID=454148 RepID=A0A918TVT6_9BACT|nr:hypothetical protein GCM10007100_35970 [Roseibacillus persicicus]
MGRLTRDPELRYTPKGTAVADLGMAINRYRGGTDGGERTEETTFVDVTLWGRQAETANQYLAKGREVFIEGRLQLDSWEDKSSGQKRSKLKVVGESMQFVGGPGGGGGQGGGGGGQSYSSDSQPQPSAPSPSAPSQGGGYEDEEDDIPF